MTNVERLATRELRNQRLQLAALGLLAGVASLFVHTERSLFPDGRPRTGFVAVGTPVLFDIGVCLVVTGVVSMMLSSLAEEV